MGRGCIAIRRICHAGLANPPEHPSAPPPSHPAAVASLVPAAPLALPEPAAEPLAPRGQQRRVLLLGVIIGALVTALLGWLLRPAARRRARHPNRPTP